MVRQFSINTLPEEERKKAVYLRIAAIRTAMAGEKGAVALSDLRQKEHLLRQMVGKVNK